MNSFEKELVRAIEHGCPVCQWPQLKANVISPEELWLDARRCNYGIAHGPLGFRHVYHAHQIRDIKEYVSIQCSRCLVILWTTENGWIPELQEIVKGE